MSSPQYQQQLGFYTMRLSAMSPRTFGSLIASADGGAGSMSRMYKWAVNRTGISAPQFLFSYLGLNKANFTRTKNYYNQYANLNNV